MLYAEVEKKFNFVLESYLKEKPDVLRFLMNHERKKFCIENLCQQITGLEQSNMRNRFSTDDFNRVIHDMTKFWAKTALEQKEQSLLSTVEKQRRIIEADQIAEAEKTIEEDQALLKQPKEWEQQRAPKEKIAR